MKKNDIFTFIAPNGEEVTAIVLDIIDRSWKYAYTNTLKYLCYAQNRLFTGSNDVTDMTNDALAEEEDRKYKDSAFKQDEIIVNYVIIPDYDRLFARYNDIEVAQTETNMGM